MPFFTRPFSETLLRASIHLLVIVISFTAMAIPVITRSSSPATDTAGVPSKLTNKQIFDIVYGLLIFVLVFFCLALVGRFAFPPLVVLDWLVRISRPIRNAVLGFRFRSIFRMVADDVVGTTGGARAAPQTHDDDASTTPVPSSHRLPTPNVELDALPTAPGPRCASSASDDTGLTSPSST